MDIKEILVKYWAEIVALFDKLYFAIKNAIESKEDAAE